MLAKPPTLPKRLMVPSVTRQGLREPKTGEQRTQGDVGLQRPEMPASAELGTSGLL